MKIKSKIKIITDIAMTVLLMFVMGYQFFGREEHEWLGVAMFVLFVLHHILNLQWHKNLFKGRYNAMRIISLVVDVLVFVTMIAQMVSGIIMSRYVFKFLNITSGMAVARKVHLMMAYWGFILMSFHIGLHLNMIIGMIKKNRKNKSMSKPSFIIGLLVFGYGIYAFVKRDFYSNMFLKKEFVFFNYNESRLWFYLDYFAIMWLFIFAAFVISGLISKRFIKKS